MGRSVTQLLQSSFEYRVVALDRSDCNVLDEAQLQCALQRHRPAAIINAAGFVPVDRAEADPENSYRLNFIAPLIIARAVRNLDGASVLFHLSSDFVFDGISGNYDEETARARPLSYYGLHKSAADGAQALPMSKATCFASRHIWRWLQARGISCATCWASWRRAMS